MQILLPLITIFLILLDLIRILFLYHCLNIYANFDGLDHFVGMVACQLRKSVAILRIIRIWVCIWEWQSLLVQLICQ